MKYRYIIVVLLIVLSFVDASAQRSSPFLRRPSGIRSVRGSVPVKPGTHFYLDEASNSFLLLARRMGKPNDRFPIVKSVGIVQ